MKKYMVLKGDEVVGTATSLEKAEEMFGKTKVRYNSNGSIKLADKRTIVEFEIVKEDE